MYRIETERLLLRAPRESDSGSFLGMLEDATTMRWMFGGAPMSRDSAEVFVVERFTFGPSPSGLGALCERLRGGFLGFAGLLPSAWLGPDEYELGFALTGVARGKGYAAEIGRAQIAWALGTLQARRVVALTHPENLPALRVLDRLGMRWVKDLQVTGRGSRRLFALAGEAERRK